MAGSRLIWLIFMLMSGVNDVNSLGQLLLYAGLNQCIVIAGYELSYETQEIMALTPIECVKLKKEGLYTCLIKNPNAALAGRVSHFTGSPHTAPYRGNLYDVSALVRNHGRNHAFGGIKY